MQISYRRAMICLMACLTLAQYVRSQTEWDAIMMNKNQFCSGPMYTHSSWKNYWEGTLKRDNRNLGTVSAQSVMLMANYGITDNLNIMAAAPYVWTKASAGTLTGLQGAQDISAFVKWRALNTPVGKGKLALYAIGGMSTPLSDYVVDYLPLSIGLGSTNLTMRGMIDYNIQRITFTGSAAYVVRSHVKIDRSAYYDTQLRSSNEIDMPDMAQFQFRTGYRGRYVIAEALVTNQTTLGGFDITRNNMPFPSNRMNATMLGFFGKYTVKQHTNLAFVAQANFTVAGRNVGQSNAFSAGIFYAVYFGKHKPKA